MTEPNGGAYRRRVVDDELDLFFDALPAISIEGPPRGRQDVDRPASRPHRP